MFNAEVKMATPHFRRLRGVGKGNWLVPANIQAHMSGVKYAKQTKDGTITLTYMDDTQESRLSERDMVHEFDGFFAVVSYVQAQRNID
jgi:hypothetical protein